MKYKLEIQVTCYGGYEEEKTFESEKNVISTSDAIQEDNVRELLYSNNVKFKLDESKLELGDFEYDYTLHVIDDNFQAIQKIGVNDF